MTQFNTITEFNNYLVDNTIKKDLTIYIKEIHSKFYNNLDISFMDYFIKICQRENEFCVNPINEFINLKIKDSKIRSNNLIITLNRSNLIENEDYKILLSHVEEQDCLLLHVQQQKPDNRGGKNKKTYLLKPKAFKKLLIDINDHKQRLRFIEYYLMLEECISYYNTYQIQYQEKLLSGRDIRIDEILKENKEQSKKIDDLLNFAKDTKVQNNDLNENINDLHEKLDETNEHLEDIKEKLDSATDDRVPKPKDLKNTNSFILFQISLTKFYILKCQRRSIKTSIKKLNVKYKSLIEILNIDYNPNTINLFQRLKEELTNNLKFKNSEIELKKLTKEDLIRKINYLNDNKKNVNVP